MHLASLQYADSSDARHVIIMIERFFKTAFLYAPENDTARTPGLLWEVGASLLLFPVFLFVLTTLWFVTGGSIGPVFAWFALVVSAAGALAIPRFVFRDSGLLAPAITLALGVMAMLGSLLVHDTSMDGQHYHFQAFYALAEGWNPIHGNAPPVIGDPITPWAIHYPRAGWILSANLLAAGFPLATVKVLNLLILFASSALIGSMLLKVGFSRLFAALLTAVAVLNPVVLSQLFTSMNDGLFGHCMLIFAASIAGWVLYGDRRVLLVGLAGMTLALNLKFSAIPIFVMLCAIACLGVLIVKGQRKAVGVGAALFATAFVAIILLGWSPYMQNYLDYGHVFHPIMGEQALDIMTGDIPALDNTPAVLEKMSGVERFFFSLFSETHSGFHTTPELKLPFTLTPSELRAAGGVDVRMAGFGPFFSGILVLVILGALILAVRPAWRNRITLSLLFMAAGFLITVIVMPQNWWARYVPQFWFVPLLIAAAALTTQKRPLQIFGAGIAAVMLLNTALVGAAGAWLTASRSAEASAQIERMAATPQAYCVYPDMVQSRIHLMREAGIEVRYIPEDAVKCAAPEEIAGYGPDRFGGRICACPD